MAPGPEVLDFRIDGVGPHHFTASWRTSSKCACRIQISTSRAMVAADAVPGGEGTQFTFDSRGGDEYGHLPSMARYWVRVLAEDGSGRECAGPVTEVRLPEGDAVAGVRALPLGPDSCLVEWTSAEPTAGQACAESGDGTEIWSAPEPSLRTYHCVGLTGLAPGTTYRVRIRQCLRREKWGDQFLRSAGRDITTPAGPSAVMHPGDGEAVVSAGRMRLVIDAGGGIRALFAGDGGRLVTLIDPRGGGPFSLLLDDGARLAEFAGDSAVSAAEEVTTEFGDGRRVTVTGSELAPGGVTVTRTISVETYAEHPDCAVLRVRYEVDRGRLAVQAAESLAFGLDRRLALAGAGRAEAWHLHAYLPVSRSDNFAHTYTAVPLEPGFSRENRLAGAGDGAEQCCGVPLFDFWCPETGLAIGHLSGHQIPVGFPVVVGDDGLVRVSLLDDRAAEITPDAPREGPPMLLAVHDLDFFGPVSRFRELMAARGLAMAPVPDEAYEPAWSTWGYTKTFTKADVRRAAPVLKDLGVRWIQFDDPWYADHGNFDVNREIFPDGADGMAEFIGELRSAGFKVRLWMCSGHASSGSAYARTHPDRLIAGPDGPVEITGAGFMDGQTEHELCPCLEENVEFAVWAAGRMLTEYGADAIYQDGVYGVPPCHDASHGHADPYETAAAHARMYRRIHEHVQELAGGRAVIMLCTCGKAPDFYLLPWVNRLATADPMQIHVRKRVKSHKALMGPGAAVDFDFVEVTQDDFASAIGTGACLYLKFTVPLEPRELERCRRWLKVSREHDLARGEYLNLYDVVHDRPECHAVRKGDRIYYAFYASEWTGDFDAPFSGAVELRGLEPGRAYRVVDYVEGTDAGTVTGPAGCLDVSFRGSLLVFAEPA